MTDLGTRAGAVWINVGIGVVLMVGMAWRFGLLAALVTFLAFMSGSFATTAAARFNAAKRAEERRQNASRE